MELSKNIQEKLDLLPNQPGVYRFLDSKNTIIYVGKAKNLKKRVSSYFNKVHTDGKTRVMVGKISDIKVIIVDKESDALLLENSMIKEHLPKYNVLLKDDKTFPWICIKNEPFPRVFLTRNVVKDGSTYLGPFTSVYIVKTLLELTNKLFPLRTCNRNLEASFIRENKYKQSCLEHHLGNCMAPCLGMQTSDNYNKNIEAIHQIFKGNLKEILLFLKNEMNHYSNILDFEKAQLVKEKIQLIEKFQAKSVIVSSTLNNIEIFFMLNDSKNAYINYIKVLHGAIVQSHNVSVTKTIDEPIEDLFSTVISEIRTRLFSTSTDILVNILPSFLPEKTTITIPQKGDKLKLLQLSERNAKVFANEQKMRELNATYGKGKWKILEKAKSDLQLQAVPVVIECFDNSNFQGTNPVAACVVFKNGKPSKKDYRKFHIKTVEGPDDFASMEEVIERRYSRLINEEQELPNLIVIDGGKGQLSSAYSILCRLGIDNKVDIISIAKRLEEIYKPNDAVPMLLDKRSETLKLIQQLRDEAHRFGITFHRTLREKKTISSGLTQIPGVGEATLKKLYLHFKSIDNIKSADLSQLSEVLGNAKAKVVWNYFNG